MNSREMPHQEIQKENILKGIPFIPFIRPLPIYPSLPGVEGAQALAREAPQGRLAESLKKGARSNWKQPQQLVLRAADLKASRIHLGHARSPCCCTFEGPANSVIHIATGISAVLHNSGTFYPR